MSIELHPSVTMKYGLPKLELRRVCREVFSKNVAKVTIEISEDSVTATKRDFQTTFPEKLSIISRGPTINDVHKILHLPLPRFVRISCNLSVQLCP